MGFGRARGKFVRDRTANAIARDLGFSRITANSLDAVGRIATLRSITFRAHWYCHASFPAG